MHPPAKAETDITKMETNRNAHAYRRGKRHYRPTTHQPTTDDGGRTTSSFRPGKLIGLIYLPAFLMTVGIGAVAPVLPLYAKELLIGRVISGRNRKTADQWRDFAKHDNDLSILAGCRKIRLISSASSIPAVTCMSAPHLGHVNGSILYPSLNKCILDLHATRTTIVVKRAKFGNSLEVRK